MLAEKISPLHQTEQDVDMCFISPEKRAVTGDSGFHLIQSGVFFLMYVEFL